MFAIDYELNTRKRLSEKNLDQERLCGVMNEFKYLDKTGTGAIDPKSPRL